MFNHGFHGPGAMRGTTRTLIAIACLTLFTGCAGLLTKPPPPPFPPQKVNQILSEIREQEKMADTFFSTGTLMIKGETPESDADILIVGSHDPIKVKIEVTHSWGRPILHILADENILHILSFPEKRYYLGPLSKSAPLRFFPKSLEPEQLWSLVRGFPILSRSDKAVSLKGNQINLLNQNSETVQIIDLFPQSNLPRLVSFPERNTEIYFSDYRKENDICYARVIRLHDPASGSDLSINLKQMTFNKPIPEAIYTIKKPADFKILPLN